MDEDKKETGCRKMEKDHKWEEKRECETEIDKDGGRREQERQTSNRSKMTWIHRAGIDYLGMKSQTKNLLID